MIPSFAARPGTSLVAQCQDDAVHTQQRRLAEIEALRPHLTLLDKLLPRLQLQGLLVYPANVRLEYEHQASRRLKVLRLDTGGVFGDATRIKRWVDALLAAGFVEIARSEDRTFPNVTLRHGSVLLRVDLPRPQHSPGTQAAAAPVPAANPASPAAAQMYAEMAA